MDPITDFCIKVIPEADFQTRALKFGTAEALNKLINISAGFCDNHKIPFLAII